MTPVRHPKQDVISTGEQDKQGQVGETENSDSVGNVGCDLGRLRRIPRIGGVGGHTDKAKNDVDTNQIEDEECLATCWHVGNPGYRSIVLGAKCGRVYEHGVKLGRPSRREREESQERE